MRFYVLDVKIIQHIYKQMRYFITFLLLFTSTFAIGGQPKYTTHLTEDGAVYFIFPQKLPASKESNHKYPIWYDVSHVVSSDTVNINLTVLFNSLDQNQLSKVVISSSNFSKETIPSIIYIEEVKGKLRYRLNLCLTFEELLKIYQSDSPFNLDFKNGMIFSYGLSKWNKHKKEMMNIINIINH